MSTGTIAVATNKNRTALARIRCQTDFAAKDPLLVDLAETAAKQAAKGNFVEEKVLEATAKLLKENLQIDYEILESEPGNTVDTYVHNQNGRGVKGVIIEGRNIGQEDLHQIALHVAFAEPEVVEASQLDDKELFKVKGMIREEMAAMNLSGKPEAVRDKIAEGKLSTWTKTKVLMDQNLFDDSDSPLRGFVGEGTILKFRYMNLKDSDG